jgi:lipid-binding SYLF domain-containing protein
MLTPDPHQVIPRHVLEKAAGFAIFTVIKAGFVVSARAGSGVVIARLEDGSEWASQSFKVVLMA